MRVRPANRITSSSKHSVALRGRPARRAGCLGPIRYHKQRRERLGRQLAMHRCIMSGKLIFGSHCSSAGSSDRLDALDASCFNSAPNFVEHQMDRSESWLMNRHIEAPGRAARNLVAT